MRTSDLGFRIVWLIAGLLGLSLGSGCGSSGSRLAAVPEAGPAYWRAIAPTCAGFPAKAGCDDGDMVLFGGLLCLAGETAGCELVRASQGADGRWWRSPRRTPGNLGESHSFSRDMAMGVLLYLVATQDREAARRWLAWIKGARACAVKGPRGRCLVHAPYRFCTDDGAFSCTVTPGNWALMARVWESLGLPLIGPMQRYRGLDGPTLWIEADTAELGFASHLTGVEAWLKQRLSEDLGSVAKAAAILVRRQPDNPFFGFIKDGFTQAGRERIDALCPAPGRPLGARSQWSWERATAEAAWRDSMGWDCLFLGRLFGVAWE